MSWGVASAREVEVIDILFHLVAVARDLTPMLVKIDKPDWSLLKGADYPGIVLMATGLGSLPPERLKYASGLFNMMRNLGGAIVRPVIDDDDLLVGIPLRQNRFQTPLDKSAAIVGHNRDRDEIVRHASERVSFLSYRLASSIAYRQGQDGFTRAIPLLLKGARHPQSPRPQAR